MRTQARTGGSPGPIRRRGAGVMLAASLLVVACSGDDEAGGEVPAPTADDGSQATAVEPTSETAVSESSAGSSTATGGDPGSSEPSAPAADVPEVVRIGTTGTVTDLDEALAPSTATEQQLLSLLFAGLYKYNDAGGFFPELAEDFPVYSDDGSTATVTLREGLVYSDGTPIVAQDVVVTLEREKAGDFANPFETVTGATAVDDRTVEFALTAPLNIENFASSFRVHPADRVLEPGYFDAPVSSGAYTIVDWVPGAESVTLEANPNYWRGTPLIPTLQLIASADATSRVLQVTTGDLEYAIDLPAVSATLLPDDVTAITHPIGGVFWIGFAIDTPGPISDLRVRQAISLAIDRQAIDERAFNGTASPVAAPVSFYRECYTSVLPNDGARDLDAARALLEEAGYADGFEFELQTWGQRPGWSDAAVVISEQLAEIGITATVAPIEDAVAIDNLRNRNLVAQFSGGGGNNVVALQNLTTEGGLWQNATGYDPALTQSIFDELVVERDADRVCELQAELMQSMWDQAAHIVPLNEREILIASRLPDGLLAMSPATNGDISVATDKSALFSDSVG